MHVDGKEVSWPSRLCLLDWQCKLPAENLEGSFRMVAVGYVVDLCRRQNTVLTNTVYKRREAKYPSFTVTADVTEGSVKLEGTV